MPMVLCVLFTSCLTFFTPHCRLLGLRILSCICPLAYALSSQPVISSRDTHTSVLVTFPDSVGTPVLHSVGAQPLGSLSLSFPYLFLISLGQWFPPFTVGQFGFNGGDFKRVDKSEFLAFLNL